MAASHSPVTDGAVAEKAQPMDWVVVTLDEVPAALQQQAATVASDGVDIRGWHNRSTRFWRRKPSLSCNGSMAGEGSARGKQQHTAAAVEQPADVGDPQDGNAQDAPRSRPRRRAAREDGQQQQRRCRSSGAVARLAQP